MDERTEYSEREAMTPLPDHDSMIAQIGGPVYDVRARNAFVYRGAVFADINVQQVGSNPGELVRLNSLIGKVAEMGARDSSSMRDFWGETNDWMEHVGGYRIGEGELGPVLSPIHDFYQGEVIRGDFGETEAA